VRLCGTGHRPEKIGGYDPMNEVRVALRKEIRRHLVELAPEHVVSGMALGFDQDLVSLCIDLKIPYTAAVPFRGQESAWPLEAQRLYFALLDRAEHIEYVCEPGYAPWKMQKRNEWMVDRVGDDGIVLAVWDGSSGGTGNCVRYAEKVGRRIVRIDPDAVVAGL
jgi:uncharacterized phage-like protein YoqJ